MVMNKYAKLLSLSFASIMVFTACNPADPFVPEQSEAVVEVEVRTTVTDEGNCPVHPVLAQQSYVEEHKFTFDAPAKDLCVVRFSVSDENLTFDEKVDAARDRCVAGTNNTDYPRWLAYGAGNATAPAEASGKCVYLFEEPAAIYMDSVEIPQDSLDQARAEYQE